MRAFAITGMVTDSWISTIFSGSLILATPPSALMSAGTRSRAITATAPASSAILACSASTTSMMTPPLSIWAIPLLTLKVPVDCPFSVIYRSPLYLLEFVRVILLPSSLSAKPGPHTGTTSQLFALVYVLFGELLEESLQAVARGPLRRRKGQSNFPPGELPCLLQHLPSSHHFLLRPVDAAAPVSYSISMRSLLAGPDDSCGLSGLTSAPTPLSVSKPALRKCPAARTRRSPGTRTQAITPKSEPLRRPSSAIFQPHS